MSHKNKEKLTLPGEAQAFKDKFEAIREKNRQEFDEYANRTVSSLKDPALIDYVAQARRTDEANQKRNQHPDITADQASEAAFDSISLKSKAEAGDPLRLREVGDTAISNVIHVDFVSTTDNIPVHIGDSSTAV